MRRFLKNQDLTTALESHNTLAIEEDTISVGDVEMIEEQNDDLMEQVADAVITTEALESIASIVRLSPEDTDLTAINTSLLGASLEAHYDQVGIESKIDFSSIQTISPSVALEDIKENIKRIWKAIVEAIKRSIQWFKDLYSKFFDKSEAIKKKAEQLLDSLTKKRPATESETLALEWIDTDNKYVESEELFKALQRNGNCDRIAAGAHELLELSKVILDRKQTAHVDDLVTAFNSANMDSAKELINKAVGGFSNTGLNSKLHPVSNPEQEGIAADKDIDVKRSPELLGGYSIVKRVVKHDNGKPVTATDVQRKLSRYSLKVERYSHDYKGFSTKERNLPFPTYNDAISIIKDTIALMNDVHGYKDNADRIESAKKALLKIAENYESSGIIDPTVNAFGKIIPSISKLLDQPQASFNAYLLSVCGQLMKYVELSTAKYV